MDECELRARERDAERQRWAEERRDRAQERDDREQARRKEADRRWDRERQVAYASLLTDLTRWRVAIKALMEGREQEYPVGITSGMTQAELLMSDAAREVWGQTNDAFLRCSGEALAMVKARPAQPEREATAARIRREMDRAQESTRAALRAELGLQSDPVNRDEGERG